MPPEKPTKPTQPGSKRSWPELWPDAKAKTQPVIQERQLVFKTPYYDIHHVTADFGDFAKEYYVTDYGDRVGLVVAHDDQILLVRQYRLLVDDARWEIPGGGMSAGETPAQAAVRECLEETGVRCFDPQPLLFYHMTLDGVHNPTHLFYTHKIAEITEPQQIHTQEVAGQAWIPLTQCIEMIFAGQIVDSFTIIALLAYQKLVVG